MWFEELFGFKEISPENVREKIFLDGQSLVSEVNGKSYQFGTLEIPTLKDLKEQSPLGICKGKISLNELVGNVQEIHCDPQNQNALFQAASQFNLLEMISPHVSPERGVGIYERDYTQGPACAIACGAGTIYRNYFVPIKDQIGQTMTTQVDCLELIGKELGNEDFGLWEMTNGYALINQKGLLNINAQISGLTTESREELKEKLKIGIQWNTQVTISSTSQVVSQVYCSALPVSYSNIDFFYYESFARLILEATYEATLHAALINLEQTDCNKVFLTLVGGGAFGNEMNWISDSIKKAVSKFLNAPLDVRIISHGSSNSDVVELIKNVNG